MKKLLVIIALLISGTCIAQKQDSIPVTTEQLKTAIISMRNNMEDSHREFSSGLTLNILGWGAGIGGAILFKGDKDYNAPILIGGTAVALIGSIMMIDSHKYIGRAGRWRFNPGGAITYNL